MERKSLFKRESASVVRSQTFAMTVESYDTTKKPNVVMGKRMDNGEAVTVSLRDDIDFQLRGRFKRSEIADFAAPRKDRQHPGTTPGGVLLVQDAHQQSPGVFGARWIQSLSHTQGEAEVFHTTIHVSPVKQSANNKDYAMMTVLHDGDFSQLSSDMMEKLKITPPFKVESIAELKEALATLLEEGTGVGVRVSNAEGFDAMYVSRKKDVSPQDAVAAFMGNIQDMAGAIDGGELTCEVVPYCNVWAGPATTEIMVKNNVVRSRLERFNEVATGSNGNTYPVAVFRPAIVAVRMTPPNESGERAVFFSHFEPLLTRQPVKGLVNAIAYAFSEHLSPEVPKPEAKQQGAASNGASAPEQHEGASFDASDDHGPLPPSEDNLMDAAGAGPLDDIGEELPATPQKPQPQSAAEQPAAGAAQTPPESRARRYGRRG
jgi:hypothetical protein